MTNQLLQKISVTLVILTICSISPSTAQTLNSRGVEYVITDPETRTVKVNNVTSSSTEISIPCTISDGEGNDFHVTEIGAGAFKETNFESIILPNGLLSIGEEAFYNCQYLNEISIPGSVLTIGSKAFFGCTDLKNVCIEEGPEPLLFEWVEGFGGEQLFFFNAPIESLKIFRNVRTESSHGGTVTLNKKNLKHLELGGSMSYIWRDAFSGFTSLSEVIIPEGITKIGSDAFSGCSNLSSLTLPDNLEIIEDRTFSGCPINGKLKISNVITTIGFAAFSGCNLSVLEIEDSEDPLIITGTNIFGTIENLYIGRNVKYGLPEGESSLADLNNSGGSGLVKDVRKVRMNDDLDSIPFGLLKNCNRLSQVDFGQNIISIGNYAFSGCNMLQKISFNPSLKVIGYGAFQDCTGLEDIEFNNTLHTISGGAFDGCSSLEEVILPTSIIEIQSGVFSRCTSLSNIKFNHELQIIGNYAFSSCTSLEEITLPSSIIEIRNNAFAGCYLHTINSLTPIAPKLANNAFIDYVYISANLNVPENSQKSYETSEGWRLFKHINSGHIPDTPSDPISLSIDLSAPGDLLNNIKRDQINNIVSLKVTGEINGTDLSVINLLSNLSTLDLSGAQIVAGGEPYYENNGKQWRTRNNILDQYWLHGIHPSTIELPQVSTIGSYACIDMPFVRLMLPPTVRKIGDFAFSECNQLVYVDIPDSVKTIGRGAFYDCKNLSEVSLGYSISSIGNEAFAETNISEIWSWNPIPPRIEYDTFDETTFERGTLHVYEPSRAKYWLNSSWGSFSEISGIPIPTPIKSIYLNFTTLTIDLHSSVKLTPTINPYYATLPAVEWQSEDESIATVDNNGLVKGVSEGETVITAYAIDGSGVKASCLITVGNLSNIDKIEIDQLNPKTVIHDLTGRKIIRITTPGVYIVNGKKVYVE